MKGTKDRIWFWVAVTAAICATLYTLSYIVTVPWHILPGLFADSTKNNYTYMYQSVYGNGYWFDGMNYPYGEHIVYTDGVPLLSVFFTAIGNVSAETALTALWWLVGLSYVLSIIFVYKILVHFKLSFPVAVVFAVLISIFSPQVLRISGHYALSFLCVIPMLFYWTIKYDEHSQRKYCVYMLLFGVVTAFLHPYFAAIVLTWGFFYTLAYLLVNRKPAVQKVRHLWPLLAAIFSVFVIVSLVMKATDPVKDRPLTPYGLLTYTTYKRDIATSIFSPVWVYVRKHKLFEKPVPHISEGGEGYSYLGLVVIAAVLFSIAIGVVHLVKKDKERIIVGRDKFSPIWLLMAVFALLLSMGVPYIWNMEWLLNRFTFLRQFRSLGRFSWMFYYLIAVYGTVVIYSRFRSLVARQQRFDGYAILFLAILVWGFEASGYTRYIRDIASRGQNNYDIFLSKNMQTWDAFLREHQHQSSDFQAILMLSFFHVGSDKLWIGEEIGENMTQASRASFQLRLPMVDVMMSRTSLSQTKKLVKLCAGPYADKPILREINSKKPFLLLTYDYNVLRENEKYLVDCAAFIGHYGLCNVYALYPERIAAADKRNADSINRILPLMRAADTCLTYKGPWYVNHIDGVKNGSAFFGNGAMQCIKGADSIIAMIPLQPAQDTPEYEFSCWFQLSDKDYGAPKMMLEWLDSAGNQVGQDELLVMNSLDNEDMWFRGAMYLRMKQHASMLRCKLLNDPNPSYLLMDEIMLRPTGSVIVSQADGRVLVNNHLFRKGKK